MGRRVFAILTASALFLAGCASMNTDLILKEAYPLTGLEAAAVYERAIENNDSEKLYYNLAYSYLEAGEYQKAIEWADKALGLYPDMLRFMYLKAYAYREASMMASYEKELLGILEKDPGNNDIRGILAQYYQDIGRDDKAEEIAMEIIRLNPTDPEALAVMAKYSEFYDSIDNSTDTQELPERPWNVPPELYDPLRILNGEGLISWT